MTGNIYINKINDITCSKIFGSIFKYTVVAASTSHNYDLSPDIVISHIQLDITDTFPLLS